MAAKIKKEFTERWEEWADELLLLMHSADRLSTMRKIEKQIVEIKKVVNEVAQECYGKAKSEKIRLDWTTFVETGEKVPHIESSKDN